MTQDMPKLLLILRGMMSIGFGLFLAFGMTELRFSKNRSVLISALFLTLSLFANFILLNGLGYSGLSKLMIILFTTWIPMVVLFIYISKDRFFKCLFTIGVMLGIFCTIYWISSFFIYLFYGQLLADILIRAILYGFTLFVCHQFIKKKFRLFVDTIDQYWGLISITSILFALLLAMQIDLSILYFDVKTYVCLALTSSLMMLMYVIVFLTFQNTHDLMLKSQTEQNMKLQIALQKEQYNGIRNKIEADRAFRHDMRHHANLLSGLLKEGKPLEALDYLQRLGKIAISDSTEHYCENLVVNTILVYHVEQARAKGMLVECKAVIPEKIDIDEMDICTALSNLLENAVEHGGGTSPQMLVCILQNKEQLCIRIQNSFNTITEQDENGNYRSTKPQGGGIGLRSVEAIVAKYNGAINVTHTETTFTVDIAIKLLHRTRL